MNYLYNKNIKMLKKKLRKILDDGKTFDIHVSEE